MNARAYYGWVWLAEHEECDEIVRYVTAGGRHPLPPGDPWYHRVRRDRLIYEAAAPGGVSLRTIAGAVSAAGFAVSYEMVRVTLNGYRELAEGKDFLAGVKIGTRVDLREAAQRVITADVIARYDRGDLTSRHVADLIARAAGKPVDTAHAVYWVESLRKSMAPKKKKMGA